MQLYRKKPVAIEAVKFCSRNCDGPFWLEELILKGQAYRQGDTWTISQQDHGIRFKEGDYIIKDENGKFQSCKPDVFEATYEPVEEE